MQLNNMANYDKETKFYWLQLKEDFFEDDAIQWLEEQKPNGRDYAYFYLKLCLKSLKSNGILIRKVGNVLIPYDNKKLAELTKIDFDTVTVAMELLKQIGLVQILDSGEIYITQLENLIGSVSKGALKKQQQRELKNSEENMLGWTKSGQMSTKDKDKDKDKDKIKNIYGKYKSIRLTEKEYEKLCEDFTKDFIDTQIELLDEYVESNNNKNKYVNFNLVLRKSIREKWFEKQSKSNNRNAAPVPDWFNKDYSEKDDRKLSDEDYEFIRQIKERDRQQKATKDNNV